LEILDVGHLSEVHILAHDELLPPTVREELENVGALKFVKGAIIKVREWGRLLLWCGNYGS